jgi:hypothetical protein
MNRRTAIVALAILCLFVTGCPKADKRITKANLAKIKVGMTRAEVEDILGPGEEIEGAAGFGSSGAAGGVVGGLDTVTTKVQKETRYGNEYTNITIIYDRADKVKDGANCITSKGLK